MSEPQEPVPEDHPPPYIIFVVVFFFFVTGLCGFLICHLLKQKGYSCHMKEDEVEEQDQLQGEDEDDDENQDTVEQILKCIIENEANMEAFNEMVGNRSVCVRHDPRLRKESIGGVPLHMHTVHAGSDLHNTCHLCAQSRNKRSQRRGSRTPRLRARPGEQTVFSVGRFRVTHNDKKNPEGGGRVPDVLVGSGEGLNQSQDSYERRDGGYNLRNMFKDPRPPPDGGLAPNAGKRRRSLTLFGLRRGSDPTGVKVVSSGREGVKFIPQPIVLEEPQTETGENDGRVGSVTIVKASPDSKREFSVVTMAEDQDVASTAAVEAEKEGGEEPLPQPLPQPLPPASAPSLCPQPLPPASAPSLLPPASAPSLCPQPLQCVPGVLKMVQEFHVLRCYSCQVFQVQQVKKVNKWICKMCGQKQSVVKEFGRGSGADCRRHVQKLNAARGAIMEEHRAHPVSEDHRDEEFDEEEQLSHESVSRWDKYRSAPCEEAELTPQGAEPDDQESVVLDRNLLRDQSSSRKRRRPSVPHVSEDHERQSPPAASRIRASPIRGSPPRAVSKWSSFLNTTQTTASGASTSIMFQSEEDFDLDLNWT
uniref:MRN complex-interacting protein N-terminal domain-containing protein n=1 Tax=Knipowitschia caucasica TaxID=637954 RepID=A0AAV2MH05_KNICA